MKTPAQSTRKRGRSSGVVALYLLVLSLVLIVSSGRSEARNADFFLGFPSANVFWASFAPPITDGNVLGDVGWTGAFRYEFGNGTTTPHAVVQGIRDDNFIYLSFQANNDVSFDNEDMIVLCLDPSGTDDNTRRIHIYPVYAGTGADPNGQPREIDYRIKTAGNWGNKLGLPAGSIIKVSSAGVKPNVTWFVEMQLPIAAFNLPTAGNFGLYFNVLRSNGSGVGEKYWPTTAPEIGFDVDGNTPSRDEWGTASIAGTGGGVSVNALDIFTNQTPTSKIGFPPASNIFSVKVNNTSVKRIGNTLTPIPAKQIRAKFRIANFGLPALGDWGDVPTPASPQIPSSYTDFKDIPANGSNTLSTTPWVLSAQQLQDYQSHDHQCILVELYSSDIDNTTFVNRSTWRNMDFGTASTFEATPTISVIKYGKPARGETAHAVDLHVVTDDVIINKTRKTKMSIAERRNLRSLVTKGVTKKDLPLFNPIVSEYTWVAHGSIHTGRYITIKGKRLEILDDMGSFGYIVRHDGYVTDWKPEFISAPELKQIGDNRYRLMLRPDSVEKLRLRVVPMEDRRLQNLLENERVRPNIRPGMSSESVEKMDIITDRDIKITPKMEERIYDRIPERQMKEQRVIQ